MSKLSTEFWETNLIENNENLKLLFKFWGKISVIEELKMKMNTNKNK